MPKLSSYKRIITSDYKEEDQSMIEQLAGSVNDGFDALYGTVNGRVDISNNVYCTVKLIDVVANAGGFPTSSTSFTLDKQGQVLGCQVILAINQANSSAYPTGTPFISFVQNNNSVLITNISNLQPNNRYTIRVIAWLG